MVTSLTPRCCQQTCLTSWTDTAAPSSSTWSCCCQQMMHCCMPPTCRLACGLAGTGCSGQWSSTTSSSSRTLVLATSLPSTSLPACAGRLLAGRWLHLAAGGRLGVTGRPHKAAAAAAAPCGTVCPHQQRLARHNPSTTMARVQGLTSPHMRVSVLTAPLLSASLAAQAAAAVAAGVLLAAGVAPAMSMCRCAPRLSRSSASWRSSSCCHHTCASCRMKPHTAAMVVKSTLTAGTGTGHRRRHHRSSCIGWSSMSLQLMAVRTAAPKSSACLSRQLQLLLLAAALLPGPRAAPHRHHHPATGPLASALVLVLVSMLALQQTASIMAHRAAMAGSSSSR